jgi:hypothetical protein
MIQQAFPPLPEGHQVFFIGRNGRVYTAHRDLCRQISDYHDKYNPDKLMSLLAADYFERNPDNTAQQFVDHIDSRWRGDGQQS